MEAYTSTLCLLTDSLTLSLICPHNAFVSHLKLVTGCRAYLDIMDSGHQRTESSFSISSFNLNFATFSNVQTNTNRFIIQKRYSECMQSEPQQGIMKRAVYKRKTDCNTRIFYKVYRTVLNHFSVYKSVATKRLK